MKGSRFFWPWVLLSVPGLGLVELLAHLYFRQRTPSLEDYGALEPVVEELRQNGQLVLISPYWAEPNLRWALGDELMPLRDVARPDESRYAEAIEVLLPGHESALPNWQLQSSRRVDDFVVQRRVNPTHEPVVFDFVDEFSGKRARVSEGREGGARRPCPFEENAEVTNGALGGHATFPKERFDCGQAEWNFVGLTVIEDQHYRPRRCLWAQPPSGKRTKVITYDAVPLGKRISGYTGAPYLIDRETKGAVIELSVKIDGKPVGSARHENGSGWKPFSVPTDEYAGSKHQVEFEVYADNSKKRDFCFYADVR